MPRMTKELRTTIITELVRAGIEINQQWGGVVPHSLDTLWYNLLLAGEAQ
jgi:hypothetical protein